MFLRKSKTKTEVAMLYLVNPFQVDGKYYEYLLIVTTNVISNMWSRSEDNELSENFYNSHEETYYASNQKGERITECNYSPTV